VVEKHHTALLGELEERLEAELAEAAARAVAKERVEADARAAKSRDEARVKHTETLNQVVRRLRCTSESDVPGLIAQGSAPYAGKLVVLVFESGQAGIAASQGITAEMAETSFDISGAPAIAEAIETKDPVIALAASAEISPILADLLAEPDRASGEQRAYLFPVVVRHSVTAMLIATQVEMSAPIELLCEAAGMRLEAFAAAIPVVEAPIAVAAAVGASPQEAPAQTRLPDAPASVAPEPQSWDDLTPEDQRLHLQAQRMARVRVAEMRLYQPNELRNGLEKSNLYGALQSEIDAARTQFLQSFLSKSSTMVDYLHLEIMRSLAHDDDRLLGHEYPGPMV
jgi:hypothetical protein